MKKIIYILLMFLLLFNANRLKSELYDGFFIIINNDVITLNEFKDSFILLKTTLLRVGQPLPPNAFEIVFNNLISEKIIQQVAQKKEIFVSDTEVEEAVNRIKVMNKMSDAAFKEALAHEGKSLKSLEEDYRKQILNEKIMNMELRPRITQPGDEELEDYYMGNKSKMNSPPS